MTLQDFILLAGGSVNPSQLPHRVIREDYNLLASWTEIIQGFLNGYCQKSKTAKVSLYLVNSPSLVCRTKPVDDGSVAILVPLGLSTRTRVFARILLGYYGKESIIRMANSLMDDIPESDWGIAPGLLPVFSEMAEDNEHWKQLEKLNSKIKLDPELERAVVDILWVAFCYLVFHEFAHAKNKHFTIVNSMQSNLKTLKQLGGDTGLRKALELDADTMATQLMLMLSLEMMKANGTTAEETMAFYWIGYAYTMIFGLYDSRRKGLDLYSQAIYPHPIVRRAVIMDITEQSIAHNLPQMKEIWIEHSTAGWKECVDALRNLDVDVLTGKFRGKKKTNVELASYVPVTAMNYTVFDQSFIADKINEARTHADSVLRKVGL